MPKLVHVLPPLNPEAESTGTRISRLRKARGMTQKQLAEKIGTSRDLIANYEKDRVRIYDDMISRLSLALGVSTDQLLGFKEIQENKTDPINPKLVRRFKSIQALTPFQQKSLLLTIDNFLKGAGQSSENS
jgi:transcriptional regulator with XRE-family HTH domain